MTMRRRDILSRVGAHSRLSSPTVRCELAAAAGSDVTIGGCESTCPGSTPGRRVADPDARRGRAPSPTTPAGAEPSGGPHGRGKPKRRAPGQEAAHRRPRAPGQRRSCSRWSPGSSTLYLVPPPTTATSTSSTSATQLVRPARRRRRSRARKEPLNILVMGSDDRDCAGQQHRQPDGRRQAVRHHDPAAPLGGPAARVRRHASRATRIVDRPECLDEDLDPIPAAPT